MSLTEHRESDGYFQSLRGKVYTKLHNDILNGLLQAGDNLIETKLSEEFGVSRTPIREALRQLELEGLVDIIPNKGAVVTGVSAQDIEDIYTIRMLIEGLAARWAAQKITEEELSELREAVELEEFYTKKNDKDHLSKFDSRFHETLFKASKSKPLMHMLKTFHNFVQRARVLSFSNPERAKEVLLEHKAILQAIIDGDGPKAEQLTNEHVKNARESLVNKIKKTED